VGSGVDLVGETGQALGRIVVQVSDISDLMIEIATSTQEQATGLNQVNTAVNQMVQVTQQCGHGGAIHRQATASPKRRVN